MRNQEKIFVIGHKNPDTDSICSAIAYADIKNRTSQKVKYIPKRAGQINEETEYVLNRFGMQPPGYLSNIGTQIKDMDIQDAKLKKQIADYDTLIDNYTSQLKHGELSVINYVTVLRNRMQVAQEEMTISANRELLINALNYWNW